MTNDLVDKERYEQKRFRLVRVFSCKFVAKNSYAFAFLTQAGEAMEFYTSIFKDSKIVNSVPGPDGKVMGGTIEIEGQRINCFNGGPKFTFTQGISLMVRAETQEEINHLYDSLSEGGKQEPCSWLEKFHPGICPCVTGWGALR